MTSTGNQLRIAAITGATGAIGAAIAAGIAAQPGYEVVLLVRDESKARRVVDKITRQTGNTYVRYALVDVSSHASIAELAAQWQDPLHILVNNAAISPRHRQETSSGIELQFATNVLGYFWLTQAFQETLTASAPARVVNVASYWAGDLDVNDLEFTRRTYRNGVAYRQSKQANRMLTVALAGRLEADGITVNACHPGDVNSRLSNDLGFGGFESPAAGADTPVWLATAPELETVTGKYFEHRQARHDRFAADKQAVEALYQACLRY